MSNFDSWKSRLADSLQNLPNLDEMAKNDEYVHSPEFRVRPNKSAPPKPMLGESTIGNTLNPTSATNKDMDPIDAPNKSKDYPSIVSPLDPYASRKEKEEEEEGWDVPSTSFQSSLATEVSAALNLNQLPLLTPSLSFSKMNGLSSSNSSMSSSKQMINKSIPESNTSTSSSGKNINSSEIIDIFQNLGRNTHEWSLLDTNTSPSVIKQPIYDNNSIQKNDEELGHYEKLRSHEFDTNPVTKLKPKTFAPLSIVEQLMSGKDVQLKYKTQKTIDQEFFDSSDDENGHDLKAPPVIDHNKETNSSINLKMYDSDQSYESDLEDDFILGLHQRKNQSSTSSLASSANNNMNDDVENQIETKSQTIEVIDSVDNGKSQHETTSETGNKKPVWFDVFDEKQQDDLANLESFSSRSKKIYEDMSDTEKSNLTATSKDKIGAWWKEVAPPELQSVSKNIVSKWKEHKIGDQIKSKIQSQFNQRQNQSSKHSSTPVDGPEKTETKKIDENEFVTADSNSLLAQDELAEFERIKQLSSLSPLQKVIDFWMEHDGYIFLVFTFFCLVYVYLHMSRY